MAKQARQTVPGCQDVPLDVIGTDPHEAMDFLNRTADTGDLHKGTVSASVGLDLVTKGIANRFFEKANFTPEQRIQYSAFRDPEMWRFGAKRSTKLGL